jgi:hypothetical protein
MFKSNLKDVVSTIVAVIFVFAEPINSFLISYQPFNWRTFAAGCLAALIAYFQGKNPNGSSKTEAQVVKANKESELSK